MVHAHPASTPGIRFPPPLIFAAALVLGLLMDRAWPWTWHEAFAGAAFFGPGTPLAFRLLIGTPFVLVGLALDVWAALTLRRADTTILPWAGATALVTAGPYRFSRNPIYLGYALETFGATLMLGALWPLALLPLAILAIDQAVIRREERHLAARFGETYELYRRRVRRWL